MLKEKRLTTNADEADAGAPRTNAEYRDEAMRRMMDTAVRLIAERGASKLSLVDVGREAGYSHSLPNYYFKTKKRMLLAVYTYIIERARVAFANYRREHMPDSLRPGLSMVHASIRSYLAMVHTDLPATRTMNVLWSEATCSMPELLEVVQPQNRETVGHFEFELRAGIRRGEVDPSIDVESVALLIVGALRGAAAQYMADPEHVNLQKLAEAMVDMLNRSIAMPKNSS